MSGSVPTITVLFAENKNENNSVAEVSHVDETELRLLHARMGHVSLSKMRHFN